MTDLPAPVRAAVGLVATAIEAVPSLPEKVVQFPVLAVGRALQMSLRAQQTYTALVVKGEQALSMLRGAPDEPPAWATFDEEPATTADDLLDGNNATASDADPAGAAADDADAGDADAHSAIGAGAGEIGVDVALTIPAKPGRPTSRKGERRKPSAFDLAADAPTEDASTDVVPGTDD
jgi:hypothetical protein